MPTDIAEDTIDLTIDLLEAVTPEAGTKSDPFPNLKATGRSELRQFRTLILENAYLQVTVVPDLGGRILRIYDKRTATDIVPYTPRVSVSAGGPRGVFAASGVQISLNGGERLNAMGAVSSMPDFSEDEEEPGGIWLGEICGDGLSFHCRISLPPERAEIVLELRVLNRTFEPIAFNPGLLFGGMDLEGSFARSSAGVGIRVFGLGAGCFGFRDAQSLAPRQLYSATVTLTPFSLGEGLTGMSGEAAAYFDRSLLKIQSVMPRLGHKVVLLTEAGQTLEAPADLYPETLYEVPLDTLPSPAKAIAILDPQRNEILRIDGVLDAGEPASDPGRLDIEWPALEWGEGRLRQATFNVAQRHLAHLLLGYRRLSERDFAAADREFEQALLFNAEDHLTWWIKAVTARLLGQVGEERAELLNAHFLAPLEPALRAESYLGSPSQTKEPSAVLRPLLETPFVFVEVAALLVEAGLNEDASKWIDEALRHIDLAMLRYLLAFAYLSASRMGVEAADQVAAAGAKPGSPPYAYRAVERRALKALRERFPEDRVLAEYAGYLLG